MLATNGSVKSASSTQFDSLVFKTISKDLKRMEEECVALSKGVEQWLAAVR
jgi:hypothetical protein